MKLVINLISPDETLVSACGVAPLGVIIAINPATLVPAPAIGAEPEDTSSTYTPGDK